MRDTHHIVQYLFEVVSQRGVLHPFALFSCGIAQVSLRDPFLRGGVSLHFACSPRGKRSEKGGGGISPNWPCWDTINPIVRLLPIIGGCRWDSLPVSRNTGPRVVQGSSGDHNASRRCSSEPQVMFWISRSSLLSRLYALVLTSIVCPSMSKFLLECSSGKHIDKGCKTWTSEHLFWNPQLVAQQCMSLQACFGSACPTSFQKPPKFSSISKILKVGLGAPREGRQQRSKNTEDLEIVLTYFPKPNFGHISEPLYIFGDFRHVSWSGTSQDLMPHSTPWCITCLLAELLCAPTASQPLSELGRQRVPERQCLRRQLTRAPWPCIHDTALPCIMEVRNNQMKHKDRVIERDVYVYIYACIYAGQPVWGPHLTPPKESVRGPKLR